MKRTDYRGFLIRDDQRAVMAVALLSTAAALFCFPPSLHAADTLVYSFETGLEGFGPHGAGITVTQDTIGATEGTKSMKLALTGPTFVGAWTAEGQLHPDIGDPPGLDHVNFDLTITEPFLDEGQEGFAVIGVMVFGVDQAGEPVQLQTGPHMTDETLEFHIEGKEPGTYPVTMDMTRFTHPVTFANPATFNDIVGTQGSGPNDMIPTSFQLYFNKTGGLDFGLTVYIDNIRVGMTTDGIDGDYNDDGNVDAADYVAQQKFVGLTSSLPNDPDVGTTIDQDQYNTWVEHFGETEMSGSSGSSAVPEPASALLLIAAVACWWATKRG
jgi:hypothetical protein